MNSKIRQTIKIKNKIKPLSDILDSELKTTIAKSYFSQVLSKEPHNRIRDLYLDKTSVKLSMSGDKNIESIVEDRFPSSKIEGFDNGYIKISNAIKENRHISVITDGDIDGSSAYLMFKNLFNALGYTNYTINTIPSREDDIERYAILLNKGKKGYNTDLVIFVDTGTTLFNVLSNLNKHDVKTVVMDHHKLDGDKLANLPYVDAMINPHLGNIKSNLNNQAYSGAGLAYKMCYKILEQNKKQLGDKVEVLYDKLNTLFLIGTISDIVPLHGENFLRVRAILEDIKGRYAQDMIYGTQHKHLSKFWTAVFSVTALSGDNINSLLLSTSLIPMLRTLLYTTDKTGEDFIKEFEALIDSDDYDTLLIKLYKMYKENRDRTLMQKHIANTVLSLIESGGNELAIEGRTKQGMLGSIASKLTQKYKGIVSIVQGEDFGILNFKIYRDGNDFVLASNDLQDSDKIMVSIRSYNDNVYKMINKEFEKRGLSKFYTENGNVSDDDVVQFGGHETIMGALIGKNQVKAVIDILKGLRSSGKKKDLEIIGEFEMKDFVFAHDMIVRDLFKGEPFDMGNEPPALLIKNMEIVNVELSPDRKYLKLTFPGAEHGFTALMYDFDINNLPKIGSKINVTMTITPGYFGNSYIIKEIV